MRRPHTAPVAAASLDESNLVSAGGLVAVMQLAADAGLGELAGGLLTVPTDKGANGGGKVTALVCGMTASADTSDDMALLRHGAMSRLFERTTRRRRWDRFCGSSASVTSGSWTRSPHGSWRHWSAGPGCSQSWTGYVCVSTSTTPSSRCTAMPGRGPRSVTPGPWREHAARDRQHDDDGAGDRRAAAPSARSRPCRISKIRRHLRHRG